MTSANRMRPLKNPPPRAGGFFLPSKDLLGIKELSRDAIVAVLDRAREFKREGTAPLLLRGKTVINLFFEPSTRTRTSFELAAKRLGANVINMSPESSSLSKGESLKDMVQNLEAMSPDLLIVRHGASGVPGLIASYTTAGVINAGDGSHEHPTQALLDALTIRQRFGGLHGLKVVIAGDIARSRVARSNIGLLTKMGASVTVCGPPTMLPPRIDEMGVEVTSDFDGALEGADVVMMLRVQLERAGGPRFPSSWEYFRLYGLSKERLARAKTHAIVMHPGPMNRGVEIASEVADSDRSVILEQVANGVAVRMAVLYLLLGGHPWEKEREA
jgi:aspartate carbamoyltransferase catalytic subunit